MHKILFQRRVEQQNQISIDNNLSKSRDRSQERGNEYLLSKIDETYGQKKFKLNYFNIQLYTDENHPREFRSYKYRNMKKIMNKESIYFKDKRSGRKKENSKEYSSYRNLNTIRNDDYNYNIHTNILKYFKNSNLLLNKKNSEIESHLDTLWKNLGVNENYIYNFNVYKNMLNNNEEKLIFILNEIENLEKFKDILNNLIKEIDIRENKLIEIKNIFEKINNENDIINLKKILNESYSNIISYIENSIRIVEYYLLFKEIINQGNSKNIKFNEEIIKKIYGINKYGNNYLLKMKIDTNFINIMKLNEFKLNKDIFNLFKADPFLTCLYNIIQIPLEIKEKIKYCQYYIIQESIYELINKKDPMSNSIKKTHITIDAGITQKNINNNLDISYYSGKITDFIPLYSEYFEKIPEEQKIVFNLNNNPMKYLEHNFYPKIIICKDKITNIIKGICIYSILFKSYEKQPNEIIIEHISSYNKEEMENIIIKILEFIKDNNIFNKNGDIEIYINLYYDLKNEQMEIDKDIKDLIEKKCKFKWVKIENTSKEIRFEKMKLIITNDNNDNNNLYNNFFIKDNFTINIVEKIINNINNNDINIRKINPYNIIYIIYLMKKIYNIKKGFDYLLNKLNKFSAKNDLLLEETNNDIAMSLVLNDNFNNDLNIKSLPNDLQLISKCITGDLNNELDINNKLNIYPLFDGCISIKYNNYNYNRIECKNIKLIKEKNTQQLFYLLNTINDKNISILISSNINDNFKNKYLSHNNEEYLNISINFKEIYNNLEEFKSDVNKYIYIPAFSIEQKYEQNNIDNENIKNVINSFNEEYKIEFLTEELIAKRNNKINNNFEYNITEEEIKNEYLIDDDFIIFILDSDVIDKIGIIPIMSIDVHKDNFISN